MLMPRFDTNKTATHFLLRLTPSLTPVGTIRGYKAPGGYYKLSRLAVLKEYRNFRFGRELVLALHDWVKAQALGAGSTEFVEIGPEFDEDGDPHQKMILRLLL
ncbi:hypothetical protein C0995_005421 [Termitomyces sp. Mi166|nr:hypothetical protein C0995_005421 [Termitomyces sp. Mi166\